MNEFPLKLKEYLAVLALELKKKKFTTTISTLVICDNGNKHHPYIITFWPKTSKNRVNICIYPSNYGLISYFDRQFNYYTDVCEDEFINISFSFENDRVISIDCETARRLVLSFSFKSIWLEELNTIIPILISLLDDRKKGYKRQNKYYELEIDTINDTYSFEAIERIPLVYKRKSIKVDENIIKELNGLDRSGSYLLYLAHLSDCTEMYGTPYFKTILGYGFKTDIYQELCVYDHKKNDDIWTYLIPILKKHNLPESLYVTDFDTYCLLNAYLKKLGVKVYFKRYGFEQNKMNCDLANFISSYFKNETQINIPFSTYLSKTLDFIRQCYLEGYDPDFNILSNNEDDYYKFIINNDNKLEHNLVS